MGLVDVRKKLGLVGMVLVLVVGLPGGAVAQEGPVQRDVTFVAADENVGVVACAAVSIGTSGTSTQTVTFGGTAAVTGGVAVRASCTLVQNGRAVARAQTALPGPAVVLAGTATIPAGPFSVCGDIYALFVDGRQVSTGSCPQ
jgi:hypothetical protein